ncbi:hypothetical protein Pan153_47140 [Gimesia panareensis]|uniref:SLA1 homology domain-containing protein n=1 Tax=Gimesia panareensis TaxID=2527978 RepID=A0A518FUM3_9PLAN|nr:hypothetical protein [Gimesia panareensis]QDV20044.1 hypothetical protein Pan153_47140 [Gimesia panareensis]
MIRRSMSLFNLLFFSLLCASPLLAGVAVELNTGELRTANWIQWGPGDTLILENGDQRHSVLERISLHSIKRLSIDDSDYDQQTILLAAAQKSQIQPARFVATQPPLPPLPNGSQTRSPAPSYYAPFDSQCSSRCSRGVILGVHEDPLNAYQPLLKQYFPNGVPTLERGHVLGLMRAATAQQALGYAPLPGGLPPAPPPLPGPPPAPFPGPAPILGQLTRISVEAAPLNTRGRADFNALAIRVKGFDQAGNPARLTGQVQIHLYGERQLLLHAWDQQFAAKPIQTISLAEWTRNCATTPGTHTPQAGNQFGAGQPFDQTWIVRLPPRTPEQNPNVYALGAVQTTLVSPGNGTFTASVPAVPLKHVSTVRDISLSNTGTRFFPTETTSEGIYRPTRINYNAPSRPDSRTLSVQP